MNKQSFLEWLSPATQLVGDNIYLQSLMVVLIAFAIANLTAFLLSRVVGALVKRTNNRLDDTVTQFLRSPLYWSVISIGILLALEILQLDQALESRLDAVVHSVLLVIWSVFAVRLTRSVLISLARERGNRRFIRLQTLPLFNNVALIVTLAIGCYLFFHVWSIDMTAWLASAGIVGIAIGFAAKDTLANLFAGIFILADAPYKIGDYIVLDNGQRGKVTHIGLRSTRILTREDVEVTVPNSIIGNSSVINESGGPHIKYRIRVPVGVAYGSDIDLVRKILLDVGAENNEVCPFPEPRVRFRRFGNSALEFELLCWVEEPEFRGREVDAINCAIYHQFIEHGVEIPYSKHDIYIKQFPGSANSQNTGNVDSGP
ncbi:mechanosensitive ion channel family protein [Halieaceae bacterium IMCC14734]|uniref:Small-conductance mechanosensitive channel n=1 Tax=Candidatus Litorirhabdus singularis TaxID=2518993 RepID=A0ABT3TF75_9GAMM|nr:mechanosensitive ion channel family protein [Candidatus Litorirhabdus singularis]MCX2980966.1 mechanosensitive ion channel family protein [Candidatus Litorirhabdus singularis]